VGLQSRGRKRERPYWCPTADAKACCLAWWVPGARFALGLGGGMPMGAWIQAAAHRAQDYQWQAWAAPAAENHAGSTCSKRAGCAGARHRGQGAPKEEVRRGRSAGAARPLRSAARRGATPRPAPARRRGAGRRRAARGAGRQWWGLSLTGPIFGWLAGKMNSCAARPAGGLAAPLGGSRDVWPCACRRPPPTSCAWPRPAPRCGSVRRGKGGRLSAAGSHRGWPADPDPTGYRLVTQACLKG
jgi:hypothetical protein